LAALATSSVPEVRDAATGALLKIADALAQSSHPEAVKTLGKLVTSSVPALRKAAIEALAKIVTRPASGEVTAAIKTLISAAASGNRDVRDAATAALAIIGRPAFDPVVAHLKECGTGFSHKSERKTLVTILGKLGDPRAVPVLNDYASRDVSAGVCSRAGRSLDWLKAKPA
jgi:HEAT repeat protein